MARECPAPVSALNQPGRNQGNVAHPPASDSCPRQQQGLTFPIPTPDQDWPVWGWPTRSNPNSPILKPGPNCLPGGTVQWGPHHCWWAEGDHIDWLGCSGLQHKLWFCKWMALKVYLLDRLLELEGTGGSAILYLGYVEVNLQMSGTKGYIEDFLLLVILTMTYSEKVSVMVGSKIIDRAMGMITKGELARVTMTYKQAHFSVVMSGSLQQPHKGARVDREAVKGLPHPSLLTLLHLCQ